ncbi:Mov34/MPN/PAD-1 family protein [Aquisphaera giovannonii]|uniref:Mov34/MPN/PAD-1 family protein n=2 Tax=Aquisphaera giovannonii TaxID=406548 RepID=A0A5B9VW30_9BACT|nr:Mov34/MPN/PAD-1 family protein [Aquisphaera giovannonii]
MSFEEVRYREPVRMLRPDRDVQFACLSYQVPGQADLPIFVDHRAADAMERHALSDTSVELGGILLGKECVDERTNTPFVWVTQSLEAKHYANTQASFTYTHDSWEEISRERDRKFPDLDIVGWYHTHPSFGIFLSHHDLFIHEHFFAQPLQLAYVIDPIQQTRGFFQWRDRRMVQVEGFYLTADRGDRMDLARVANEIENFPSPQGQGGGGLSPRLEAELIKMLSRPAAPAYVPSPADRAQAAVTFGLLGMLLGMIGIIGALWMYQLNARMQEQADTLKTLAGAVDRTAGSQRLAVDTLLDRAGKESPADFQERYERVGKARDEARAKAAAQEAVIVALGERTKDLEQRSAKLAEDLAAEKEKAEANEADAKLTRKLRDRVADLESDHDRLKAISETVEGKAADEALRRLGVFKTATYALGFLSLALAAALAIVYTRSIDEPASAPSPTPPPRPSEPTTHRIT